MLKRNGAAKYYILFLVCALGAVGVGRMALAQSQRGQSKAEPARNESDESYEEHMAVVEALRRGGLKAAAKLKGNFVRPFDPHPDWLSFGMEKLTASSEAVVVGVPVKNVCELTPDGQLITTNYDVIVQEVLKGDVQPGSTIKVALVGGRVTFPDGTTAEVVTPSFEKMINGRTYLLYLSQYKVRSPMYDLTGGPQGMIDLPGDGAKVKSHGRDTDPVKNEVKDMDAETFLKEVRRLAKKWPQPGKCCN
jgi:hypothetical protein